MSQPAPATRHVVLAAAILALLTIAAYAATFHFGIINFDDDVYLATRSEVMGGLTPANIRWALTSCEYANYFPCTWLSYQLEMTLWPNNFPRFHVVNVVLHASTVVMLMLFFVRTTGSLGRGFAIAALFALHPAHVESVAWLAERKDVLSTALGMGALLAYVRYARAPSVPRMILVTLLLMLALLSKSMLVTWPAVMLLMDIWPLRRIKLEALSGATSGGLSGGSSGGSIDAAPSAFAQATARRLVIEKIPLLVMSLGISVVTFYAQRIGNSVSDIEAVGVGARLANAAVGYVRYIGLLFWPVDLALLYPLKTVGPPQAIASIVLIVGVSIVVFRQRLRRPYLLVGWLWFLGTLVPVIGLVQIGVQAIADRYSYIPHMGLIMAIVWGIAESPLYPRFRPAVITLLTALLVTLGIMTRHQTLFWRDSVSIWSHARDVTHDNVSANSALAAAYIALGKEEVALPYVLECVRLAPEFLDRQNTAGMLLLNLGRPEQAVPYLRAASRRVGSDRGSYVANVNLIKALRSIGKAEEAEVELHQLLNDPDAPRLLVEAEFNLPAAIETYRARVNANPRDAVARNILGVTLARSGDLNGAVEQFEAALKINPNMSDVRDNLEHAKQLLALPQLIPGQAHP